MSMGKLIAWIKIHRRIWLTYIQGNGGGHFFNLLLTWSSIMLTKYIANATKILENIDWMPLTFTEPLLMRTTAGTERICRLQYYLKVVSAYITLQTICSWTVSVTGLPRAPNECSLPGCKGKLGMFLQKMQCHSSSWVFWIITVSRAVCKVYLRQKKESYIQKQNDFPFSFPSLFTILAIEHKIYRDKKKTNYKNHRKVKNLFSSLHNICLGKVAEKSFYTSIFDHFQFIFTRTFLMLASV